MCDSAESKLLAHRDAFENAATDDANEDGLPDVAAAESDDDKGDEFVEGLFEGKSKRSSRKRVANKKGKWGWRRRRAFRS